MPFSVLQRTSFNVNLRLSRSYDKVNINPALARPLYDYKAKQKKYKPILSLGEKLSPFLFFSMKKEGFHLPFFKIEHYKTLKRR